MTKNDLIRKVQEAVKEYPLKDVSYAVRVIFDAMTQALLKGERIEIRGFGILTVRNRKPKTGRNPKTSGAIHVSARRIPVFKTGKELRNMINTSS
jgi:integration host factor subunit beta